jgi:hypothetical protein
MPLHLEPLDLSNELEEYESVLIVSCPICPPVSIAAERQSPVIEFFKSGVKTRAYEDHLKEIRESLEKRGIRTSLLTFYVPSPMLCLWTAGQRKRLLKRASDFDAVLVMGCESARYTVEHALEGTDCKVLLAMQLVGITNATLKPRFPSTIAFEDLARVGANEVENPPPIGGR